MAKYVRTITGDILISNPVLEMCGKASDDILDLLEVDDFVRIEYYAPRGDQRVCRLFQVDSIIGGYLICLECSHMNFTLCDNKFSDNDIKLYNPVIKSIITKERIKSIEYTFEKNPITSDFKKRINNLHSLYEFAHDEFKPVVEDIIRSNNRDIKYLEEVLEQLLNIPYDPCYQLFIKLCDYIASFDIDLAKEYLDLYKNLYVDDDSLNIKKTIC